MVTRASPTGLPNALASRVYRFWLCEYTAFDILRISAALTF